MTGEIRRAKHQIEGERMQPERVAHAGLIGAPPSYLSIGQPLGIFEEKDFRGRRSDTEPAVHP